VWLPVPVPEGCQPQHGAWGSWAGSGSSQRPGSIPLAKGRILPCPPPGSAGASSLAPHLSGSTLEHPTLPGTL